MSFEDFPVDIAIIIGVMLASFLKNLNIRFVLFENKTPDKTNKTNKTRKKKISKSSPILTPANPCFFCGKTKGRAYFKQGEIYCNRCYNGKTSLVDDLLNKEKQKPEDILLPTKEEIKLEHENFDPKKEEEFLKEIGWKV